MKSHNGVVFGTTFGVVSGVLLGIFVHPFLWILLPIGLCGGLVFDMKNKKSK